MHYTSRVQNQQCVMKSQYSVHLHTEESHTSQNQDGYCKSHDLKTFHKPKLKGQLI